MRQQTTSTVLMVRPVDFAFNEQTSHDNEFQHNLEHENVNAQALQEFEQAVNTLQQEGVHVIVLEKSKDSAAPVTPDAIFPNNWIATSPDGTIYAFPMYAPNRRAERSRLFDVEQLFDENNFSIKNVVQIGQSNENKLFLEGTGSMVNDHQNGIVYAAISVRTNEQQVQNFVNLAGYKRAVAYRTKSSTGKEFYHTNVVQSVGDKFAVICSDCIEDKEPVLQSLKESGKEVIEISLQQTEKSFCGNILQLSSHKGDSLIVMSESAYNGFTKEQLDTLQKYGKLVTLKIPTIEHVGGGSARCMLAEVFLPKKQQ